VVNGKAGERRWSGGGGALHVVTWGDETVAFHESTASTHLFDEDAHRLVETLQQGDGEVTDTVLWNAAFGEAPTGADRQALDEILETLLQAGLVTATSP
jgi:PqqD family protein of HPr-rel-A system